MSLLFVCIADLVNKTFVKVQVAVVLIQLLFDSELVDHRKSLVV